MSQPSYPKNNIGRPIIPLTLVNNTGQKNLYIYAVGTTEPQNARNNKYYLSDFKGNVEKCVPAARVSYSMPVEETEQVIYIPMLSGLRFYFSFGKKIYTSVPDSGGNEGIPNEPAGWLLQNENCNTLFDYMEMTWEANETDTTIGANLTQVDGFGIPMYLEVEGFDANGKPVSLKSGFNTPNVRNTILNEIAAQRVPWKNLVISDNNFPLRVICPYHGMKEEGNDLFPDNQLDKYIDDVWKYYETTNLETIEAVNVSYTGRVINNVLTFTPNNNPNAEIVEFEKPDTRTIYLSGPLPKMTGERAGIIQTWLQAGFLRSTLMYSNKLPECDVNLFYKNDPVNQYAKIIHENSKNSKAYAFGYDDVCDQSSVVIPHNPVSAKITLVAF